MSEPEDDGRRLRKWGNRWTVRKPHSTRKKNKKRYANGHIAHSPKQRLHGHKYDLLVLDLAALKPGDAYVLRIDRDAETWRQNVFHAVVSGRVAKLSPYRIEVIILGSRKVALVAAP